MFLRIRQLVTIAALVAPLTLAAQGASPRDHVARAVAAIGGEAALRSLRSTSLTYQRLLFGLGQAETPLSPARGTFFSGESHHDYVGGRRRIIETSQPAPGFTIRFSQVFAQGVVHNDNSGGISGLSGPPAVAAAERLMRLAPERLLLAALGRPAALTALPARQLRGEPAHGVRYRDGADTLNLWFDRASGVLLATETLTDDAVLGDRRTLTMYTRWNDAGNGVMLPRQVDTYVNDELTSHMVLGAVRTNSAADSLFAIADSVVTRLRGAMHAPPSAEVVTLVGVAPGVWRAEGGSHHSLVVEQGNQLLVVEAPQSAARFNAVLDTLRARFPARSIGSVVMSHHHWDHSGGVRAALAAGLPIVAHQRNAAFVRGVARAPKTLVPDALTRRPRAPVIRTVGDSLVLGTGAQRVVLYLLPNNHAEGMLAAWHPASRVLFVVDILSPDGGNLPRAGSREVLAMVQRHRLDVDRVVGGHGGVAPWADVVRAAAGS